MELTGKCKKDFEKWYKGNNFEITLYDESIDEYYATFYELPFSMSYGVYVDFFDSVGVYCEVLYREPMEQFVFYIQKHIGNKIYFESPLTFKTRPEARTKAIKQANIIYNETP